MNANYTNKVAARSEIMKIGKVVSTHTKTTRVESVCFTLLSTWLNTALRQGIIQMIHIQKVKRVLLLSNVLFISVKGRIPSKETFPSGLSLPTML